MYWFANRLERNSNWKICHLNFKVISTYTYGLKPDVSDFRYDSGVQKCWLCTLQCENITSKWQNFEIKPFVWSPLIYSFIKSIHMPPKLDADHIAIHTRQKKNRFIYTKQYSSGVYPPRVLWMRFQAFDNTQYATILMLFIHP